MASFLLRLSFFHTTNTIASSEAMAYYRPAPSRTDGIQERHQRQWIINLYLQIRGCYVNMSWITGLGKIHKWVNRVPPDSEKHLHVYTSSRTMSRTATNGVLTQPPGKTGKKNVCVLRRLPIGGWKKIAGLNGIRCNLVKGEGPKSWYSQAFEKPGQVMGYPSSPLSFCGS